MLKFSCPECEKLYRVDDSKAGRLVKCSACGHKIKIPAVKAEANVPTVQASDPPKPRKKKRRKKKPKRGPLEIAGNQIAILAGAMCLMYLLNLIVVFSMPPPDEQIREMGKMMKNVNQDVGKNLPDDEAQMVEAVGDAAFEGLAAGAERDAQEASFIFTFIGVAFFVTIEGGLLFMVYLRQNWARIILAVWYILCACFVGFGLLLGGWFVGRVFGPIPILESIFRGGTEMGIACTLISSRTIKRHTYAS